MKPRTLPRRSAICSDSRLNERRSCSGHVAADFKINRQLRQRFEQKFNQRRITSTRDLNVVQNTRFPILEGVLTPGSAYTVAVARASDRRRTGGDGKDRVRGFGGIYYARRRNRFLGQYQ